MKKKLIIRAIYISALCAAVASFYYFTASAFLVLLSVIISNVIMIISMFSYLHHSLGIPFPSNNVNSNSGTEIDIPNLRIKDDQLTLKEYQLWVDHKTSTTAAGYDSLVEYLYSRVLSPLPNLYNCSLDTINALSIAVGNKVTLPSTWNEVGDDDFNDFELPVN